MKITISQLKALINETLKTHVQDEADVPGQPRYKHGEPVNQDDLDKLGPGIWPGWHLEGEELEELVSEPPVTENVLREIIKEGVMLERLGVLDQFELDLVEIGESLVAEAKYKGREVKLGKPMKGDVKKYKVYVKDPKTGNVKKVNFGDPNMEIRRDNPKARKSFRARHGCGTPRASDRTKAAYWACRLWSTKPVSKILKGK